MDISAAAWSAVAATFAALSSFLVMLIQRRNLLEAARPEILLSGWSRTTRGTGDGEHEVIGFKTIRNVGRGPVLHGQIRAFKQDKRFPIYHVTSTPIPFLPAGEAIDLDCGVVVWWSNVPEKQGGKFLPIEIQILAWDSQNRRHETTYKLFSTSPPSAIVGCPTLAPGVALSFRTTRSQSVRLLMIRHRLSKWRGWRLWKAVPERWRPRPDQPGKL